MNKVKNRVAKYTKMYAVGGGVSGDPTKPKKRKMSDDDINKFGDWDNSGGDTKITDRNLMKLGLLGAEQAYFNNPDINKRSSIIGTNSDWLPSLISTILKNSAGLNIRNKTQLLANKDVVVGSSKMREAINNPAFNEIYSNFWDVLGDNILPNQWKKYDATQKNNNSNVAKMATGGNTMGDNSNSSLGLYSILPGVLDNIMSIFNNNPNSYSRQPIVNATTIRNMVSPYSPTMATGGTIDDLDAGQQVQLQELAAKYGIEPEQMYEMLLQQQQNQGFSGIMNNQDYGNEDYSNDYDDSDDMLSNNDEDDTNTEEFGSGGWIKKAINPAHKGWCTPLSNPHCTGHRRALALLFKRKHGFHKHAFGGMTKANVEGGEVMQIPGSKNIMKINGPKHEDGGVNMHVPDGTKVYSDRLAINGVDMKDRKLKREARLKKLEILAKNKPHDVLLRNTINRTTHNIRNEERKDMALQNFANRIYNSGDFSEESNEEPANMHGYGGRVVKFDMGGSGDPYINMPLSLFNDLDENDIPNHSVNTNLSNSRGYIDPNRDTPTYSGPAYHPEHSNPGDLTTGDYIGMAGTLFGSVAPIFNTEANKRNTQPVINRYAGVGAKALDTNQALSDLAYTTKANAYSDLETQSNSAYKRNANSATDVNTLRNLNTATDIATNKGRNDINNTFSREMMGVLGDREKLQNLRDMYVAYGATGADDRQQANIDNYFTNMGANYANLSRGIQTIGRNFNTAHSNRVDANLISQLSRYGLEFDENGNLVNKAS